MAALTEETERLATLNLTLPRLAITQHHPCHHSTDAIKAAQLTFHLGLV
jgi:hypothetical protein